MMKNKIKQEKGVTLSILVITIIVLLILTSTLIYNAKGSIHIQNTTKLYNDLELLREKVSEYYNEYGEIPGKTSPAMCRPLAGKLARPVQSRLQHWKNWASCPTPWSLRAKRLSCSTVSASAEMKA